MNSVDPRSIALQPNSPEIQAIDGLGFIDVRSQRSLSNLKRPGFGDRFAFCLPSFQVHFNRFFTSFSVRTRHDNAIGKLGNCDQEKPIFIRPLNNYAVAILDCNSEDFQNVQY